MKDFLTGEILLVDKPKGWTSFDVCNKLRGVLRHSLGVKKIKVGHSGTLDPLATGLLVIATGKRTKALHGMTGLDKKYDGTIKFGAVTASYDAELPEENHKPIDDLDLERLRAFAQMYTGPIDQVPPIYSAVKKDGVPAYKVARAKGELKMEPRPVVIHEFDILDFQDSVATFSCHVSKGTYVRSMAHDLGQLAGCGAYLSSLRRTTIGDYRLEDALPVTEWVNLIENSSPS